MLQPKSYKYRKQHRGRLKGIASKGTKISFGEYGLKAQESSWISARQIEAARRVMTRYTRKGGKYGYEFFPTSQSLLELQKREWVKEKEMLTTTFPLLKEEKYYLKFQE